MLVQEESGADKKNSLVVDNDPRRNIVQSTLEVPFEEETTSDEQIFHLLNKSLGNLTKKFPAEKTNWWRERLRMILKEAEREKGLEGDLPVLNHLGEQETNAGEPLSLGGGKVKTLHKRDDKLRKIAAQKKELSRVMYEEVHKDWVFAIQIIKEFFLVVIETSTRLRNKNAYNK